MPAACCTRCLSSCPRNAAPGEVSFAKRPPQSLFQEPTDPPWLPLTLTGQEAPASVSFGGTFFSPLQPSFRGGLLKAAPFPSSIPGHRVLGACPPQPGGIGAGAPAASNPRGGCWLPLPSPGLSQALRVTGEGPDIELRAERLGGAGWGQGQACRTISYF